MFLLLFKNKTYVDEIIINGMEKVSKYATTKIAGKLNGKRVHFTSDCSLFPNFDIKGKVMSTFFAKNSNLMFKFKTDSGKVIDIDSKMHNLQFEILS